MLQRQPNRTELRLMDSYIQIFVDSKKVSKKFLHRHYPVLKNLPLPPTPQMMRKNRPLQSSGVGVGGKG